MSEKDKIQQSGYLPEEFKEIYKKDFEELVEQEHKKIDEKTNSLVSQLVNSGKRIILS